MNLTNAIRTELADKLAVKVIEKHAAKMGGEAERLSKVLEEAHLSHLAELLPEVKPDRYPTLIRSGVLTGTMAGADHVYFTKRNEEGVLSQSSENPGRAKIGKVSEEERNLMQGALLKNSKWSRFFSQFSVAFHGHSMEVILSMEPRLSRTLPDFRGRTHVYLSALEPEKATEWSEEYKRYVSVVAPLFFQARDLAKAAAEVFWLALEYRREVSDLLAACKTDKQLRELFPEAAELLPAPKAKANALAPVELASKVRRQLKEGVPA